MKSLERLLSCMVTELGDQLDVTTERDVNYITSRFRKEGYSFLGVTLASFCKDFERSLADGVSGDTPFLGFRRRKGECLPEFLSGFTSLIFTKVGVVRQDADPLAIFAVRQITSAWSKCEFPMSHDMRIAGSLRYLATEKELHTWDESFSEDSRELSVLKTVFDALYRDVLNEVEQKLFNLDVIPRHGPGKTADRRIGNAKWTDNAWPARLNRVFPYQEFKRVSVHHDLDCDEPDFLYPGNETPVRVTFVPKTIDKCRTIAMEQTNIMFAQQAVMRTLVESFRLNTPYGSVYDFIRLDDQTQNRELARQASLTGNLATLDLSDASDRLSNQLVRALFHGYPLLFEVLDATRSRKADVLGKTIRLSKYASMGSALCFPIESMIFLAIAVMSCLERERTAGHSHPPISRGRISRLKGSVSVYGDDIIVPVSATSEAVRLLCFFGFKINERKSFWTGKFRESCGADWYNGNDISITRLREPIVTAYSDREGIASLVAFRNDLFQKRGLWKCAEYLDGIIWRKAHIYPSVDCNTSEVLGAHTFSGIYPVESPLGDYHLGSPDLSWDTKLHRYVVKGVKVEAYSPVNSVDGWDALLKFFLERGSEPLSRESFARSGRPDNVLTSVGWGVPK